VKRVSGGVPRLLFLSNIIRSKGVSVLIEACRFLKERRVDFHCTLVGAMTADYPGDSLVEEIRRQGVEERVSYTGPVYGEGKWEAFAKADVFVHPTLNDSFPLVVLEAMGTGLPVVTTDEGAIPEMVRDGVDGLICPKSDPKALADTLERLLSDAALRTRMGESGRIRYRELYTLEQFEKRFVDILKDA
jgi:glycosyltransferase involved in cell wall biosynthesis